MISLRPARIPGRWVEGYALDLHTEGSRHVGTDDQGHPLFETRRTPQPVTTLAVALARETGLRTKDHLELKNVREYDARLKVLANAHEVDRCRVQGKAVLLFDDLYRSGATMNSITAALYDAGGAAAVYGLILTRTRSRR